MCYLPKRFVKFVFVFIVSAVLRKTFVNNEIYKNALNQVLAKRNEENAERSSSTEYQMQFTPVDGTSRDLEKKMVCAA